MNLDDVKKIKVPRQKRKRVGRGAGSGLGKTAGRGNKGAGQRSGHRHRLRFEGGQMPLYRRLPKMGFSNARFKVDLHVVNVGDLQESFEAGADVSVETLKACGLLPKRAQFVKILGFGDLDKALTITAHGVSAGAREKIEAAKGSIDLKPVKTVMRPKFAKKGAAPAAAPEAPTSEAPTSESGAEDAQIPEGDEA